MDLFTIFMITITEQYIMMRDRPIWRPIPIYQPFMDWKLTSIFPKL